MPFSDPNFPDSNAKEDAAPRLVGWKDIASYLGKADRTVKRWGSERGLPVHRVPGAAKTSVYAYPAELDQWLESTSAFQADSEPDIEEQPQIAAAPAASVEAALAPANSATEAYHGSWSAKRKWATALAAVLVFAVALDATARLTVGTSAASVARRFWVRRSQSVQRSTLPVSDLDKSQANDFYLRGRYEWNQRTPESLNRALDLFTQAIVHDPSDARAYAGLADTYDLLREYTTARDDATFSRAIAAARKAVALDDSLPEAHRALAYAEMYGTWDFGDADKEFRRAIALNPKDSQARLWYANALSELGRFPEALDQMDKAQELDPSSRSILADKGLMLYNAGRMQEGLGLLKEVEQSAPDFRSPHFYLMRIDLSLRDYPGFLAEGERTAQAANDPAMEDVIASARAGYAHGRDRGLLNALYAKQGEYFREGKVHAAMFAATCVLMGKKQEAVTILEDAYNQHDIEFLAMLSHPDLRTLKDEPRYQALARKIDDLERSSPSPAQNLAAMEFGGR
ncbi:MAG: tetratricopeptide repeat protein [Terracidiphilus sp.]|jgi:tetratricopeptide (TPR) repeat protein